MASSPIPFYKHLAFDNELGSSESRLTRLEDIPVGTSGIVNIDPSIAPVSNAVKYVYLCTGSGKARLLIVGLLTSSGRFFGNVRSDGGIWRGWKELST